MARLDLSKFTKDERRAMIKLAKFVTENQDSIKVTNVPYRKIKNQIHEFEDPETSIDSDNKFLEINDAHINSMLNVVQDFEVDVREHYNNLDVSSGLGDTMVNDPGGMKDRDLSGIQGLMENGLRRF